MIVTKVVDTVEKLRPTPIIFLQESLAKSTVEKTWGFNEHFYHQDGRIDGSCKHRSGLYTPPSVTVEEQNYCNLTKYFNRDSIVRNLDERTFGQIVHLGHESKLFRAKLVTVSVHMPNKGTHDKKKHIIVAFFEKMCSLANDQRSPVVIGGDFNLDVSKWKEDAQHVKTGHRV